MQGMIHIHSGKPMQMCVIGEDIKRVKRVLEFHPSWMGSVFSITPEALRMILKMEGAHLRLNHLMGLPRAWNMVDSSGAVIARIFVKEK